MAEHKLMQQSITKSFFQYLIPTMTGMMLMSLNIVLDGIFVGNGVGSTALASINIASPVFSIVISLSLLIGIGGGALYSIAVGRGENDRAKRIFTLSLMLLTVMITFVSIICYWQVETLAKLLGANKDTLPFAVEYMKILLIFALFLGLENALSIFVRNDENPNLAMMSLVVSGVVNIILNYWMIFILHMGVQGAALATGISILVSLFVLCLHFFKKESLLKLAPFKWDPRQIRAILSTGFPSFLSEAGILVFVVGYNITISYYGGTKGLAAFSVINYLHTFMFLAFIGLGSSVQPMISFFHGAQKYKATQSTLKIAVQTAFGLGVLFILVGFFGAKMLASVFGVTSPAIVDMTVTGMRIFFTGYLFIGINFVYMTYYQSMSYVKPATRIILFRGFILLIPLLYLLPKFAGIIGIWLALPIAEGLVALTLLLFVHHKNRLQDEELNTRSGWES